MSNTEQAFEEVQALIPRQYVGKWKNDDGHSFNVLQYVDRDTLDLKKLFVPVNDYRQLEVKTHLGKNVVLFLGSDDDDRIVLKGIRADEEAE